MKLFINDNFMLKNNTGERLYHEHAKGMPIFDYHCHLDPREIAENARFENIAQIWLKGDHYKWRALRANGIEEKFITGGASDKEKFMKWAQTIPYCMGNPLYHWTHLELKRYFGIDDLLSPKTAEEIWEKCNDQLGDKGYTARSFIEKSNVKVLCTTDDPADSLEHHIALKNDKSFNVKVLPAFRPETCLKPNSSDFVKWVGKLESVSGIRIESFEDLKSALENRVNFFHEAGCRLSDHSLEPVVFEEGSEEAADKALRKAVLGETLSEYEAGIYVTQMILFLGRQYCKKGWVMQFHIGALRNNSRRMLDLVGANAGFDSIGDSNIAEPLSRLLNSLDETDELPKTILYCLNPGDNEVLATMAGNFTGEGVPGKVQFGSGWWYNDQKDGMIRQLTALSNLGLLSRFVGMLTDSRSLLSYTRHEYFRRILCNLIGEWVEAGEIPDDMELLGNMVRDICFNNANGYFNV